MLLQIEGLDVIGREPTGRRKRILHKAALTVNKGEVVALIGESGAGKTTLALAALGYFRPNTRPAAGTVRIEGQDMLVMTRDERSALRGKHVAYVAQSPSAALNPAILVGRQIAEPMTIHNICGASEAARRAVELLRRLQIPDPPSMARRYPHQASGGQQQRIMLAMSMACSPQILVLDEPTTALDVTTQIEVLNAIKEVIRKSGTAAIYVSHDLAVVAQIADRILVMKDGHVVEQGSTDEILNRPQHEYTRSLLAAAGRKPPRQSQAAETADKPVLSVRGVSARYGRPGWLESVDLRPLVLREVSFEVQPKEVLAIVGETGSGKTTLARIIAGLHAPSAGTIEFDNAALPPTLASRSKDQLRRIQIVFQSPEQSLNPQQSVGATLSRALRFYFDLDATECERRARALLREVGLPEEFLARYPGELSGGQRQRVSIARALAAEPDIILCDEILSALDVVVAARIIELMKQLQQQRDIAYVFISHDLTTVASLADRVGVMYAGRLMEIGPTAEVFKAPHHPYTDLLVRSVPELRQGWLEKANAARRPDTNDGAIRIPTDEYCAFRTRCPLVITERCDRMPAPQLDLGLGHRLQCHRDAQALRVAETPR